MLEQFQQYFNEHKFVHVPGFVSPDLCNVATSYALFKRSLECSLESTDGQVPGTHAKYGDHLMESLLMFVQPWVENITGLKLLPTHSYYRVYKPGDELVQHVDRPACEISCSLCLGAYYAGQDPEYRWGLWLRDVDQRVKECKLEPGDAVIYRGSEVPHWRKPLEAGEGSFHVQVFMYFVDANGKHAEWRFDKRPRLGVSGYGKSE